MCLLIHLSIILPVLLVQVCILLPVDDNFDMHTMCCAEQLGVTYVKYHTLQYFGLT